MNCDRIARLYRWIEYAAFGRRLERHRFQFLPESRNSRNALLLGDGDGRFAAALARINSHVRIECVESSARMVQVAKDRLQTERIAAPERIQFMQADALRVELRPAHYDLIVTNFFLDCFSTSQSLSLITAVRAACCPGAHWMVSDFQRPSSGWRALYADVWLRTMYLFFRVVTGLKINTLPAYAEALRSAGFVLQSSDSSMAGLICSELWTLTE